MNGISFSPAAYTGSVERSMTAKSSIAKPNGLSPEQAMVAALDKLGGQLAANTKNRVNLLV